MSSCSSDVATPLHLCTWYVSSCFLYRLLLHSLQYFLKLNYTASFVQIDGGGLYGSKDPIISRPVLETNLTSLKESRHMTRRKLGASHQSAPHLLYLLSTYFFLINIWWGKLTGSPKHYDGMNFSTGFCWCISLAAYRLSYNVESSITRHSYFRLQETTQPLKKSKKQQQLF